MKYFNKDRVVCRYLTFLGHTCAEYLKKEFEEGIQELDTKKMVQVSMNGPNVSWKLYDSIVDKRNQNDDCPAVIGIGSRSLHVAHGAFKSGVQKKKGELMVVSMPCTTCLMSPLQKEKLTKHY